MNEETPAVKAAGHAVDKYGVQSILYITAVAFVIFSMTQLKFPFIELGVVCAVLLVLVVLSVWSIVALVRAIFEYRALRRSENGPYDY